MEKKNWNDGERSRKEEREEGEIEEDKKTKQKKFFKEEEDKTRIRRPRRKGENKERKKEKKIKEEVVTGLGDMKKNITIYLSPIFITTSHLSVAHFYGSVPKGSNILQSSSIECSWTGILKDIKIRSSF